jgi:uroporphyrinogen decarboxylase
MVHWENDISPTERFKALLRGEKLDRVCIDYLCHGHNALIMGYKNFGEYYEYPKVWIKCLMASMEMYQQYIMPVTLTGSGPLWMEAWGSEFAYPYDPKMGSIALTKPAVKKPEDVDKLEVPDPELYMSTIYEDIELALERGLLPFAFMLGGWISFAAYSITEPETFMFWIIKEPDLCHKLLDLSTEFAIREAELLVKKFGPESWIAADGNPTDANVLISADTFAKFPLPRAIKMHRKVLEMGVPMWYTHWCAEHKMNIEAGYVEKIPMGEPGILSFGPEVPIEQQVERFGKLCVIQGNVDPVSFMYKSFDDVLELCRQNVEVGMNCAKGYMLGCGCELPPPSPPANVYALTKAARDYGKYK